MKNFSNKKTQWHLNVTRPISLLNASLALSSDLKELSALIKTEGYSQGFIILENGIGSYYSPRDEVNKNLKQLLINIDKLKKVLSNFQHHIINQRKFLKTLEEKTNNKNYSVEDFRKFFKIHRYFVAYRIPTRIIGYRENLDKKLIKEVAQLRIDYKKELINIRKEMDKILLKVAEDFNITKRMIDFLTYKEFLDCLAGRFNQNITKRAQKKLVLYESNLLGRIQEIIYIDRNAEDFIKKTIGESNIEKSKNIIKGKIACSGYAKGIVKKILIPKISKDTKRFILITSMTTPDFVPILNYVDAIVTDEGGLTCHAAIISRELNIPCIIGTKIATKILHDGQIVEVDANKGVIKIIK